MNINNIVVIRFSLRFRSDWHTKAYGAEENRNKWFAFRFSLFENLLARSLRQQTVESVKNFLLMDDSDREIYAQVASNMSDLVSPIFSVKGNHTRQVADEIKNSGLTNLAISRVDSDDVLLPDYFEQLNRCITGSLATGIDCSRIVATGGYRASREAWQELLYSCSPFLTRFCPVFNGENVYDLNHETIESVSHVKCDTARWMQVVHDSNVSNGLVKSIFLRSDLHALTKGAYKIVASTPMTFDEDAPSEIVPYFDYLSAMPQFGSA